MQTPLRKGKLSIKSVCADMFLVSGYEKRVCWTGTFKPSSPAHDPMLHGWGLYLLMSQLRQITAKSACPQLLFGKTFVHCEAA